MRYNWDTPRLEVWFKWVFLFKWLGDFEVPTVKFPGCNYRWVGCFGPFWTFTCSSYCIIFHQFIPSVTRKINKSLEIPPKFGTTVYTPKPNLSCGYWCNVWVFPFTPFARLPRPLRSKAVCEKSENVGKTCSFRPKYWDPKFLGPI